MWDRREWLYQGLQPAADPRDAVVRLVARGMHLSPEGPHRVQRTVIRRPDLKTGDIPPPERDETVVEGPPITIAAETAVFGKHREVAGRHLFALSYEQTLNHVDPRRRVQAGALVVVERAEGGWFAYCGCGLPNGQRPDMVKPFVSEASGWNRELGYRAAMRLHRGDADVTALRLRFADGETATADTEDDLALFLVEQPARDASSLRPYTPEVIELLRDNHVVATQRCRQRVGNSPR